MGSALMVYGLTGTLMVKGIGRTFQRGIGAGIQADLSEAKTPYRPTSQNYGQRVMETQTNVGLQDRKATQGVEITGDVSTLAEEISGGQAYVENLRNRFKT